VAEKREYFSTSKRRKKENLVVLFMREWRAWGETSEMRRSEEKLQLSRQQQSGRRGVRAKEIVIHEIRGERRGRRKTSRHIKKK
jgi:hypothetical protein